MIILRLTTEYAYGRVRNTKKKIGGTLFDKNPKTAGSINRNNDENPKTAGFMDTNFEFHLDKTQLMVHKYL